MLKKSTGFWFVMISFFPGGPELLSHLADGNVNDLFDIEDRYSTPEICQGVLDTFVNLFPGPHVAVFQLF